jgi:hypothetical protein
MKRVQAANSQIVTPAKSVRPSRKQSFYRPQRGQLFIAIALLPVELRPLRLMAHHRSGSKASFSGKGISKIRVPGEAGTLIQAAIQAFQRSGNRQHANLHGVKTPHYTGYD